MILSLDTETTGSDWRHGARPFFVTTCDDEGNQVFWEFEVNAYTREVSVPSEDRSEIIKLINAADTIVGQNLRFDIHALYSIGIKKFPWYKVQDTLIASHILASNQPHNLTDLVMHYLGKDIQPLEDRLHKCVEECRRMCRLKHFIEEHGRIAIASKDREDMPSAGDKLWRLDYWLPKAIAELLEFDQDHEYWSVLKEYSNADSAYTLALWPVLEQELKQRGYWEIYTEKMQMIEPVWTMERQGISYKRSRLEELRTQFQEERDEAEKICLNIASDFGYALEMPKGASPNGSLREFMLRVLELEPQFSKKSKTDAPSLDRDAMTHYLRTLPRNTKHHLFVRTLLGKRARDTAIGYMNNYERYGIPLEKGSDWFVLHPNLNPTGTATTRLSCSNPNGQNISNAKEFEEEEDPLPSIRYMFGPLPGREWYSDDYENLELRIPAYVAQEQAMIELFEKPDDPPYFGSYHLLRASIFFPDEFWPIAHIKGAFKKKYPTLYHNTKIAGFALNYQAGEKTVDKATGRPGCWKAIKDKLPLVNALNARMTAHANKFGFVETLPNKTLGNKKGYPLLCTRNEFGSVLPTTPLSYFVQGTAGDCMVRAIIRVRRFFKSLNAGERFQGRVWKGGYHAILTIHDELISDCPKGDSPQYNLPVMLEVKRLMELSGQDIGLPLKVSMSYHPENWAEEVDNRAKNAK